MAFKKKKILIGITGSIAAYKAAYLVRLFVIAGAEVKVIMTKSAADFIGPLTISTLSKNPVYIDFIKKDGTGQWNNHVELGLWADLMIIAPASANSMAKMAAGISDNLLIATYLSARCPVYFAPAMDKDMYQHPATGLSIKKLLSYNNRIIKPGTGELASGLFGEGRMAEPDDIFDFLKNELLQQKKLIGKTILISAGPTYEKIDPVRFIGNHSSGKMGFAIANQIANSGGKVILVAGPVSLKISDPNIKLISVESAEEMYRACIENFDYCDAAIMAAAVADYRPIKTSKKKIKKSDEVLHIELEPTKDILADLGKKKTKQIVIGFALETNNELENAQKKLKTKNADMIVLNSLNVKGAGFNTDTNKVWFVEPGKVRELELMPKSDVADEIVEKLGKMFS